MRNSTPHRLARGHTLAALAWPVAAFGLACSLPMLVGCQTASPWAKSVKRHSDSVQTAKSDTSMPKNDFHKDVSQDQQYNMHLEFGRVLESEKQFEPALAEYQKALDACTRRGLGSGIKGTGAKQSVAHRRMGGALDRLGRFAQAEAHYQLALKANPDDANVWNDSGYSYYMQSRWVDAERNLKTAAKLAPDNIRIQTNLGLVLAAAGKTDDALAALSKAGGSAIGHANLGYLLAAMGQTDKAREHYEIAIQLQPNLGPARQALTSLASQSTAAGSVTNLAASPTPTSILSPATTVATSAPAPAAVVPASPSDVRIEQVSTPAPRPAVLPLQTLPDPRVSPASAPPLSGPQGGSSSVPPFSMAPVPQPRTEALASRPPGGPRAKPVAVTPEAESRTALGQSLSLSAYSRAAKPLTGTRSASNPVLAPRRETSPTLPMPASLAARTPTLTIQKPPMTARATTALSRASLPPNSNSRNVSAATSSLKGVTAARDPLPPIYDPRKGPAHSATRVDPSVTRTSLPPVYAPGAPSVPATRDYNPRMLPSSLPPVYDPRIKPVPRTTSSDPRVIPMSGSTTSMTGAKPSALPPVYDPRRTPAPTLPPSLVSSSSSEGAPIVP